MHENFVYDFCALGIKANTGELKVTDHRLRFVFHFYTCFNVVEECNFPLGVLSLNSFDRCLLSVSRPNVLTVLFFLSFVSGTYDCCLLGDYVAYLRSLLCRLGYIVFEQLLLVYLAKKTGITVSVVARLR
ncbi:hypothetical protein RIF29_15284 [Crotalaria pallida]|uniref:Uncharacterized protein n=1 Tax=Crotalaria pallida TaxID=3830 RepID=A0AAN9FEU8_CROPI